MSSLLIKKKRKYKPGGNGKLGYIYIKSYHDQRMQCTGEFNALNHTFICHKQKSSCKNCRIH